MGHAGICSTVRNVGVSLEIWSKTIGEIAEAVMMFVRADTLAGRVMVWPDGETWRLVPVDSRY